MNCKESFELIYRYLDKDLTGATFEELEVHFKICRSCWDRVEFEKRLKERLKNSCCKEKCSEALRERIKALLEKY